MRPGDYAEVITLAKTVAVIGVTVGVGVTINERAAIWFVLIVLLWQTLRVASMAKYLCRRDPCKINIPKRKQHDRQRTT